MKQLAAFLKKYWFVWMFLLSGLAIVVVNTLFLSSQEVAVMQQNEYIAEINSTNPQDIVSQLDSLESVWGDVGINMHIESTDLGFGAGEEVLEDTVIFIEQQHDSAPIVYVNVVMPVDEQGTDWKAIISWAIAGLNGIVLLVMNIKKLRKPQPM